MPTAEQRQWILDVLKVTLPPDGRDTAGGKGGFMAGAKKKIKNLLKTQKPVPRTELGKTQEDRADKLLKEMSKDDQVKVKKILDNAKCDEKKYLTKALANKHTAVELETFNKKIAGKNKKWMEENLHLVGESKGKGIKQQWHDSCGPTTVQAMMGELDPIYALNLHEQNKNITKVNEEDGLKLNKKMAEEQKTMLEGHGGIAASRDKDTGQGMVLDGLLNEQTGKIGVKFNCESTAGDKAMGAALDDAEKALKGGLPVPVRVGGDNGGHFVLMTGIEPGPPRRYSFHDPWEGKTLVFTDEQIKTNKINIAGWTKMTHIYKPSASDRK